jgi:putative endonuclease
MVVVYAIWSELRNRIYVGMTTDLVRRVKEHNLGKTKSTKPFRPWKLIYTEECDNWETGRIREKYYKSGIGKEYLKKLVP